MLGMSINAICHLQAHGFQLAFLDSDDYMRLVRIRDFFAHGDWNNTIISRCNVPFGCDLHWTRFYDFFFIVPVYVLNFFLNSIDESIKYVGFVLSPLVKCATIVIFFGIAQKLVSPKNAYLLTAIFAGHPVILELGFFGRPDHHAFIMLFIIIHLHYVMKIVESKFSSRNFLLKTAVVTVLCIWISPETLIPLILADTTLYIYFFFQKEKREYLYLKNILTAVGISVIAFIPYHSGFFSVMVLLLTAVPFYYQKFRENIIARYWPIIPLALMLILLPSTSVEYDKISALHGVLYLCSAIYFGVGLVDEKCSRAYRILASCFWLLTIGAVFLFLYPKFLYGMGADIDDYLKKIWLSRILEMQSPLADNGRMHFIAHVLILVMILGCKIRQLVGKFSAESRDPMAVVWWILIADTCGYTILGGMSYRMLYYMVLFGLPIIVDVCLKIKIPSKSEPPKSPHSFTLYWSRLGQIALVLFFSMFYVLIQLNGPSKITPAKNYTTDELFSMIDELSATPVVIMASANEGAQLVYFTKHCAVGAHYHRQPQGIIACHRVMEADYDEQLVKSILEATNSSYIFIRKADVYTGEKQRSLARMIVENQYPPWIVPLDISSKFSDIIVAKINREKW